MSDVKIEHKQTLSRSEVGYAPPLVRGDQAQAGHSPSGPAWRGAAAGGALYCRLR